MGEYLSDGTKIGTCEDLYYTTFTQLLNCDDPLKQEYLGEHGYRYRFPFPDEKSIKIGYHDNFDRKVPIMVTDLLNHVFSDVEHRCMFIRLDGITKLQYSKIGANLPCPYGDGAPSLYRFFSETREYCIVQQKQVDGRLWLVMECPICGSRFRLPPEDGMLIAQSILENECAKEKSGEFTRMQWIEIAIEIIIGYANPL